MKINPVSSDYLEIHQNAKTRRVQRPEATREAEVASNQQVQGGQRANHAVPVETQKVHFAEGDLTQKLSMQERNFITRLFEEQQGADTGAYGANSKLETTPKVGNIIDCKA